MQVKSKLRLVTPAIEKRAVAPRRPKNAELRRREHLTSAEVERLTSPPGATATVTATPPWSWSPTGMAYVPPCEQGRCGLMRAWGQTSIFTLGGCRLRF
jgi:hypothetical protein